MLNRWPHRLIEGSLSVALQIISLKTNCSHKPQNVIETKSGERDTSAATNASTYTFTVGKQKLFKASFESFLVKVRAHAWANFYLFGSFEGIFCLLKSFSSFILVSQTFTSFQSFKDLTNLSFQSWGLSPGNVLNKLLPRPHFNWCSRSTQRETWKYFNSVQLQNGRNFKSI